MVPAALAWLDYSEADQRRAREIITIYSRSARVAMNLGLGRIRDALSDTLFPGTSVLLTRARYFLFVPWLFREGEGAAAATVRGFRPGSSGRNVSSSAHCSTGGDLRWIDRPQT